MIDDPEAVSQLVIQALHSYDFARKSKANLNHRAVYAYCQDAVTYCAIASCMLTGEPKPLGEEALAWVMALPRPNGLFPMLIKAVEELDPRSVPLLNFILSIPTSTRNLYLVEDALAELFNNIAERDEEDSFAALLPQWRNRL